MWCRHRRNIANTLVDTNDIINTLEALIGGIMHVIAILAYAPQPPTSFHLSPDR